MSTPRCALCGASCAGFDHEKGARDFARLFGREPTEAERQRPLCEGCSKAIGAAVIEHQRTCPVAIENRRRRAAGLN